MENRASAIIISKRHILLIHRIRAGQEYYVFPGGHVEKGESAEEACIREVQEETGLQTAWLRPAFDFALPDKISHFFFVEIVPGRLTLGGPEFYKQSEKNRYHPEWLPLVQIGQYPVKPEPVRDALAAVLAQHGIMREAVDLEKHRAQLQEILAGT